MRQNTPGDAVTGSLLEILDDLGFGTGSIVESNPGERRRAASRPTPDGAGHPPGEPDR